MNKPIFISKYKPSKIEDFDFDTVLSNFYKTMISLDNLNLLIIGPRGAGKTTILNVLISSYYENIDKYNDNVLSINSLNGQGIDYFRNDVKIFCQIKSSIPGKKKLIILDDIDSINDQNQQVFRNFIDKYKNNVHFIASCANNQKVIESVQSRLTIVKMPTLTKENMINVMDKIIKTESINIDDDAKETIIDYSNNNAKTLINYMEKIYLLNQHISKTIIEQLCTSIGYSLFETYTEHIKNKELIHAIDIMQEIYKSGYSVMDILDSYFNFIKISSCLTDEQKYIVVPYICKYISVFHNIHEDEIELTFFTNNLVNKINNNIIQYAQSNI